MNGGHARTGPVGSSVTCAPNTPCDFFYSHAKSSYGRGELYVEKSGHASSHSVFQTQIEYLCDVSDNPLGDVPLINRQVAAVTAATLSNSNIVNPVPFSCGSPSLLSSPLGAPPPVCGGGGKACNVVDDCFVGLPPGSGPFECDLGCCNILVK